MAKKLKNSIAQRVGQLEACIVTTAKFIKDVTNKKAEEAFVASATAATRDYDAAIAKAKAVYAASVI